MNIYVGNLPYSVTEEDLRDLFSEFGEIISCNVISDRYTGQSKGFGFVEMADSTAAEQSIQALDGSELQGRTIKVNQAKPRPSNRGGGGGGGGYGGGRSHY